MSRTIRWCLMAVLASTCTVSLAQNEVPEATAEQTEQWLTQHIVAWDDSAPIKVRASQCSLTVTSQNKDSVINFGGILLPLEILRRPDTQDAFVRVRVKNRYSGDYSMERRCGETNAWCERNVEKWSPISYFEFRISHVSPYDEVEKAITSDKAAELVRALEHFGKLCGAKNSRQDFHF